ncbi:MAG: carboxypeptidase regulatory-like domain-containing protein, partial [Silvibacterium sp.]
MKVVSSLGAIALLMVSLTAQAATVTGNVVDRTTNKPAAGDDVVLIAFQQGMREAGRTKTDARGRFSIDVPDTNMHLIRVDHQKAAYFEPLPPGTTKVNIDVYDVAANLEGVSTEADVMRIEAGPQGLHVIQNYFVKNDSNPPRTQFSTQAYQIYLPPDAKIEGSAAMGPGGMPVSSSPMPQADKGHYAFVFPIRPGETRFQLSYTLPYNGSYKFTPRVALPTDNIAVMLPKSMTFEGGAPFQAADVGANAQTYLAKNVLPSQSLVFTVSGTGVMPRDSEQTGASAPGDQGNGGQAASAENDNRPGGGLANPIDTPDPLQKYKWWILSGLALVLVIAAAFFLRAKPSKTIAVEPIASPLIPTPAPSANPNTVLSALKDEL